MRTVRSDTTASCADDVIHQADFYKDLLKKRLNINLKSVCLYQKNFGNCDINWFWQLEKHGYFINRDRFFRSQFLPPSADPKKDNHPIDPAGIGEEAEKNALWQRAALPGAYALHKYSKELVNQFTESLLQDLKKRDVYVDTFGNIESFRRQRNTVKIVIDKTNKKDFTFHVDGKPGEFSYFTGPQNIFSGDFTAVRNLPDTDSAVYQIKHNTPIHCNTSDLLSNASGISSVSIAEYPNNAQASLVFSIDDTNRYMLDDWYPLLKKHQLPEQRFFLPCQETMTLYGKDSIKSKVRIMKSDVTVMPICPNMVY